MRQIPTGTSLTLGEAWTIAFTYFTVAITVSLVHSTAGTPPWIIVAATLLVNSATATLAYAAVTAAGGSATAGVVAGCLTATRFGVLAAALAPRLWPERWKRAVAAFAAFDPNIALANREQKDADVRRVYVAMSLWLVCLGGWELRSEWQSVIGFRTQKLWGWTLCSQLYLLRLFVRN